MVDRLQNLTRISLQMLHLPAPHPLLQQLLAATRLSLLFCPSLLLLPLLQLRYDLHPCLQHLEFVVLQQFLYHFAHLPHLRAQLPHLRPQRLQPRPHFDPHPFQRLPLRQQTRRPPLPLPQPLPQLLHHPPQLLVLVGQPFVLLLVDLRGLLVALDGRKRDRRVERCVQPVEVGKQIGNLGLEL